MNFIRLLLLIGVSFFKSERGGDIMEHEGYEYLVTVRLKDGRSWRCREYRKFKCPATAKTRGNPADIDPSHESKPHNHEGNPVQVCYMNLKKSAVLNLRLRLSAFIFGYIKLV